MSDRCYGLIGEGDKDIAVYRELIIKICGSTTNVATRSAGGRERLFLNLSALLRTLEHAHPIGKAVDKALVVRDADGRNPQSIEKRLRDRICNRSFHFTLGIGIHVVVQEMDTWLLADTDAINKVSASLGGRRIQPVRDALEQIQDPKAAFQTLLSEARLNYTPEVCRLIAAETDLAVLRRRCPSFVEFERKTLDP